MLLGAGAMDEFQAFLAIGYNDTNVSYFFTPWSSSRKQKTVTRNTILKSNRCSKVSIGFRTSGALNITRAIYVRSEPGTVEANIGRTCSVFVGNAQL
jgi:hypothetical protein